MKKIILTVLLSLMLVNLGICEQRSYSLVTGLHDVQKLKEIAKKYEESIKANPKDIDALLTLGIAYHNISVEGDRIVSKTSYEYLKRVMDIDKKNVLAMVYLGSVRTLMGRDASNPMNKIKFVNEGIKLMDSAVDMDEKNIEVRLVRLNNSPSLPSFFKRQKMFFKDAEYLLDVVNNRSVQLDNNTLEVIYYSAGEMYKMKNDLSKAKEFWKKTILVAKQDYYKTKAQERLRTFFNE